MSESECLQAMASVPIGRVGITHAALPTIVPVNFVMIDRCVCFAAMSSSVLAAATKRSVVAFQVDSYDYGQRSGWTVVGVGQASWLPEGSDMDAIKGLVPVPWATGHRPEHIVKIDIDHISGRAVVPLEVVSEAEEGGSHEPRSD